MAISRSRSVKPRSARVVEGCKGNIEAVVKCTRVSLVLVSIVEVECGRLTSRLSYA